MINIFADRYLHNITTYLPSNINLNLFDPANGLPDLESAHALLIRTVSPINKQTLPNIPTQLKFIGTASAGTDHVDINYLRRNNIRFSDAAGCNARSVAEYVGTALLLWAENRNIKITKLSAGIIGAGQVGTRVIELADKLGIRTVVYDPPREKREASFTSASVEEVLACDILSFHTPLTTKGPYPTFRWLNRDKLATRNFKLIINTSRGGVIDESALLEAKNENTAGDFVIDVWENEPDFNLDTAEEAFIKTPHIAGYSEKAKNNASKIVAENLLEHFDIPKPQNQKEQNSRIVNEQVSAYPSLSSLLTELHPIRKYEEQLESIIQQHSSERGKHFNNLRTEFPLREEFQQIYLPSSYFKKFPVLKDLGFSLRSAHSE